MNVLIVDKKYSDPDPAENGYIHLRVRSLRRRGHDVVVCSRLPELPHDERDLGRYDVAVAHPDSDDAEKLLEELQRRKDFRMLLHSGDSRSEEINLLRESEQVCNSYHFPKDVLIRLVEEGW